ncbi:MAG: PAS domain S-box protein [SAR324 cluster bacterium]|jgi:PAS domain S-box-containing protein|nr:hypothetical protein [Deltaproteobacteria bacterium]MDP6090555.1 PAS domain S-box protein [SAR324 cluster bacterium]MDP6245958.1 PAS domain S-box protein [SAR324 cluster bacterium]MDP6462450.1 PAS domain S-box protein [SAR324 cluster bacterium]MDP6638526.1 PAS domain S-box protein [SAR324 cluster bacterium]|tara:strand:+ start:1123 stop:2616 length:1494 start_codon:yes stop_codon:yes gene_type:complete
MKPELVDHFSMNEVIQLDVMEGSEELFDTIDTLFLKVNPNGSLNYCNRVCREASGYSLEEMRGRLFWEVFFPQEEGEFIRNLFEEALEAPYRSSYENQWRCREGGFRLISFTIAALFEKGEFKNYSVTGLDVTKLRRMEEELWQYRTDLEDQISQRSMELLDSRNRLAGIVDSAEDAIISVDSKQQITLFNIGAEKTFGYLSREVEGRHLSMLIPNRFHELHRKHVQNFGGSEKISKRMDKRSEISAKKKDGTEFHAEANISQVTVMGEKIYTVVLRDISERKLFEKQLQDSLNEKETLLREIHHRVKNNLQVISSLFTMQRLSTDDPDRLTLIQESQHRIQSMALIHEKIYQSDDLNNVRFDQYIQELVTDIFQSYEVYPGKILLQFELKPISLHIDMAIPCSLILNELTSNTLKYAFPGERTGNLLIRINQDSQDQLHLLFEDDGQGLPSTIEMENVESLGLRLVRVLTNQLRGKLDLKREHGTSFSFHFPIKKP